MKRQYKTAIIGFGAIAYGYGLNKELLKEFPTPTHFAAIDAHPNLHLDAIVDIDEQVLERVNMELKIGHVSTNAFNIPDRDQIDIAVLSCPPYVKKIDILRAFPNLKGVVIEKPIGLSLSEVKELNDYTIRNQITTQVAYLRRADTYLLGLKNGSLKKLIGEPIKIDVSYGNGFKNNGSHMLDLIHMLFGSVDEIIYARNVTNYAQREPDDLNISCAFKLKSNVIVSMVPIDFEYYRENSCDIWGTRGRLVLTQEGSYFQFWKVKENRFGVTESGEIDWSQPNEIGRTQIGNSLSVLYENLIQCIENRVDTFSSLSSALEIEKIIYNVINITTKEYE